MDEDRDEVDGDGDAEDDDVNEFSVGFTVELLL